MSKGRKSYNKNTCTKLILLYTFIENKTYMNHFMNIQFFVCFHNKIIHELYEISQIEKNSYLTFYGVKEIDNTVDNSIYEFELVHYNRSLQTNKYNEGSCIYHVFTNRLYEKYDYIGFCQYDMIFRKDIFKNIEYNISKNTIFYLNFFEREFLGGQLTIVKDFYNIPAGLTNYNAFFNTNYTTDDLICNKMVICNTFLIPTRIYVKMMYWLKHYFKEDIQSNNITGDGHDFNPGHMIEALTSMFLSLEICQGAKYQKLDLEHNHNYKIFCD